MVVHNKRVFHLYKTLDLGRRFVLLSLCQQKFFSANAEWVRKRNYSSLKLFNHCNFGNFMHTCVTDVQDFSESIREQGIFGDF